MSYLLSAQASVVRRGSVVGVGSVAVGGDGVVRRGSPGCMV